MTDDQMNLWFDQVDDKQQRLNYEKWVKDYKTENKDTVIVCTCGGDSVNATFHSDYCDKNSDL